MTDRVGTTEVAEECPEKRFFKASSVHTLGVHGELRTSTLLPLEEKNQIRSSGFPLKSGCFLLRPPADTANARFLGIRFFDIVTALRAAPDPYSVHRKPPRLFHD
jgi:hypothetical protein